MIAPVSTPAMSRAARLFGHKDWSEGAPLIVGGLQIGIVLPDGSPRFFPKILCPRCGFNPPRPRRQAFLTDPDLCAPCDEEQAARSCNIGR